MKNTKKKGFVDAGKAEGNIDIFTQSAENIVNDYLNSQTSKEKSNQEKKNQIDKEIVKLESEKTKNEKKIVRLETDHIEQINQKISTYETEIVSIKADPENHLGRNKLKAWTSALFLIVIFFYLFIFYSSALYSAVFRDFSPADNSWSSSIFYPSALENTFEESLSSFLFLIFGSFVFAALGFILSHFESEEKKLQIVFTYLTAFILDSLLAYHISMKLYELKSAISFLDFELYSLDKAIMDSNYWLIIFMGFIAYIVWGLLYKIFNNEFSKSNKLFSLVSQKRSLIELEKSKKEKIFQEISVLKENNDSLIAKIEELSNEKDAKVIDVKELKNISGAYSLGWMNYMENADKSDDIGMVNNSLKSILGKYQPEEK